MNIVGVDIGGTFTDLVGCVDGRIVTSKTSTVPADPTRGVADSLALAALPDAGDLASCCTARPSPSTPCWSARARAPR